MDFSVHLLFFLGGLFVGATILSRFLPSSRLARTEEQSKHLTLQTQELESRLLRKEEALLQAAKEHQAQFQKLVSVESELQKEKQLADEKLRLLSNAQEELSNRFKLLSGQALKENHSSFLEMAKETFEKFHERAKGELDKKEESFGLLVKPIKDSLSQVDQKIQDVEKARTGAYESLKTQIHSLLETQKELRNETANLVNALKTPTIRGRWGEIQLKRVVEMAGMLDHCDFYEQQSSTDQDTQKTLRPDLIVRLPGQKYIVIDSKTSLSAYLEAVESSDEADKKLKLQQHAKQIRTHIHQLSKKSYWDQFNPTPEFVVLFLPGENFFASALEQDPSLIELGVEHKIVIATPTTLIALLRAVAYGWTQDQLTQNAEKISQLGKELYKRLGDLTSHLTRLGRNLNGSVEAYNKTVGSFESRVFSSARKFAELYPNASEMGLTEVPQIDHQTRTVNQELK